MAKMVHGPLCIGALSCSDPGCLVPAPVVDNDDDCGECGRPITDHWFKAGIPTRCPEPEDCDEETP